MKKLIVALFALSIGALYFSCQKDDPVPVPTLHEEDMIEQIVAAPTVNAMTPADLPTSITAYVAQHHAPFHVEAAFHAPQHGYEAVLENGLCLFFDAEGNHLNHDGMHGDDGNHHGNGTPGFSHCMMGDTLDAADLPTVVVSYVSEHYPGIGIQTVVVKPSGKLGVELANGTVLMFFADGSFIHECDGMGVGGHGHGHGSMGGPGWHCDTGGGMGGGHHGGGMGGHQHGSHGGMGGHHGNMGDQPGIGEPCWGGTGIAVADLPTTITNYVATNHANATIAHAMQTFNGNYFLRLTDCARLVFDENGVLIFDSGD